MKKNGKKRCAGKRGIKRTKIVFKLVAVKEVYNPGKNSAEKLCDLSGEIIKKRPLLLLYNAKTWKGNRLRRALLSRVERDPVTASLELQREWRTGKIPPWVFNDLGGIFLPDPVSDEHTASHFAGYCVICRIALWLRDSVATVTDLEEDLDKNFDVQFEKQKYRRTCLSCFTDNPAGAIAAMKAFTPSAAEIAAFGKRGEQQFLQLPVANAPDSLAQAA